jgi:hypothetical protein
MGELIRPLFPPGHSLDAQLLLNFRPRAQRLLETKAGEVDEMSFSQDDETMLTATDNLDEKSPAYFTESFRLLNKFAEKALSNPTDIGQIESYLESLSQANPTFKFRILNDAKGNPTGYVWQTGVIRRDLERYGSTLFVDRLGRPLNNKGWPLMTIAMLSGEKKVCIPSEAIVISEHRSVHFDDSCNSRDDSQNESFRHQSHLW